LVAEILTVVGLASAGAAVVVVKMLAH